MTKHLSFLFSCAALLVVAVSCCYSLSPQNVAVVVNTNSYFNGASEAVGRYYCDQAGVPLSNLIEVEASTAERIPQADFVQLAAELFATSSSPSST